VVTVVVLALVLALAQAAGAQARSCPRGTLPAYAHNDYLNARPLTDALVADMRGVEVDVFLVDDVLRVGHDRNSARRGARLDSLYLSPLRALVARCGALTAHGQPFLLTVEIKEASDAAYAALIADFQRYRVLLAPRPFVSVVLVGWHPETTRMGRGVDSLFGIQHRISSNPPPNPLDARVRLLSLDYGKTMGRFWVTNAGRQRWLAILRAAKRAAPDRLVRVHNVPADAEVYGALFDAGVDVIGATAIDETERALSRMKRFDH
jgi:hypothetical protein